MSLVLPSDETDSEQATLTDTWSDTDDEDADSAPTQRVEFDAGDNECQFCGNHVTSQFARIFGDNDGVVHCCQECATFRELQDGCAAQDGYTPDDGEVNW